MPVMRDDTPYHARPPGEVQREQDCMRAIFAQAPEPVAIWEAFGGLGKTGKVLSERFPRALIHATDLDAGCVEAYNSLGIGLCTQGDARVFAREHLPDEATHWGISLDYNRLTLLDLRGRREGAWKLDLLGRVMACRPLWVEVTDSAASHMHINWAKYGLGAPSVPEYVSAFGREVGQKWRYVLAEWSGHSRATYMLFERNGAHA